MRKLTAPAGDEAGAHRLVEHAHVDRLDDGDLVGVGVDQVGQAVQVLGAPGGPRSAQSRKAITAAVTAA